MQLLVVCLLPLCVLIITIIVTDLYIAFRGTYGCCFTVHAADAYLCLLVMVKKVISCSWYVAWQKITFRTKIGGGAGLGEHPKNLGPLLISATVKASNFKFGTQIVFGTRLPKTTLGPTLALVGSLLEYFRPVWCKKARMLGVPDGAKTVTMCITV